MNWLKDIFDKRYVKVSLYVIISAVIIKCLFKVADDAAVILDWCWSRIGWIIGVLKPVVIGFVLAYLANPVIKFFEKRLLKNKFFARKARGYSVFLTLLIIIAAFAGIISVLVYSVTDQLQLANFDDMLTALNQFINSLNEFYNSLMQKLESIDIRWEQISEYVTQVSTQIFNVIRNGLGGMLSSLINISGYFTTVAFGIIIGIYFMLDGKIITGYLNRISRALFSEKSNERIHGFISDLHTCFSGYLQGQLTDVLFMIVAISITLSITGVKFGVLIGVLAGLANLIPYLGPFVAYGLTAIVCVVNGQYQTLFVSFIALFIIQAVDGNFVGPKLLSRSIKIHPLLVIVFLIFGSAIGGFAGMLLAVPVGGFVKVLFHKWLIYKEKQNGNGAEKKPEKNDTRKPKQKA